MGIVAQRFIIRVVGGGKQGSMSMTRREIVKAAIRHEETGIVPFHVNLAGDAIQKYLDTLYKRYVTAVSVKLLPPCKSVRDFNQKFCIAQV
jgi:hypothetical protein